MAGVRRLDRKPLLRLRLVIFSSRPLRKRVIERGARLGAQDAVEDVGWHLRQREGLERDAQRLQVFKRPGVVGTPFRVSRRLVESGDEIADAELPDVGRSHPS